MRLLTERDPVIMDNGDLKQLRDVGGGSDPYTLPIASSETLGGVKVGENLTIGEDGTLNASGGGGTGIIFEPVTLSLITDSVAIVNTNTYYAFRLGDYLYISVNVKMVNPGQSRYVSVITISGNNEFIESDNNIVSGFSSTRLPVGSGGSTYGIYGKGESNGNTISVYNGRDTTAFFISLWGCLQLKPRS